MGSLDSVALLAPSEPDRPFTARIPLWEYADFLRASGLFREIVLVADLEREARPEDGAEGRVPFDMPPSSGRPADIFYVVSPESEPGRLTENLLEGVRGAAANTEGVVTGASLRDYLDRKRLRGARLYFQLSGDVVFARRTAHAFALTVQFDTTFSGEQAHVLTSDCHVISSFTVHTGGAMQLERGGYIVQAGTESIAFTVTTDTTLHVVRKTAPRHVIVTGTASHELSSGELWLSEAIGRMLGEAGHALLTAGFEGVDFVAAREFARVVKAGGRDLAGRLTHFVAEGRASNLVDGHVVRLRSDQEQIDEEVQRADAVIVIGGRGGALRVVRAAQSRGISIFPIASTGGDAAILLDSGSIGDVPELGGAIASAGDAETMARRVRHLLATRVDDRLRES